MLIDGPAGSGKSTVANELAVTLGGEPSSGSGTFKPGSEAVKSQMVQILHGDDMLAGWDGLPTLGGVLMGDVLEPLAYGGNAAFNMWDWERGGRGYEIPVVATDILIIEGVGVGQRDARQHANLVLYVDAPMEVRLERGIERDGEGFRGHWIRWMDEEAGHFVDHGTREAADVIIDGLRALRS